MTYTTITTAERQSDIARAAAEREKEIWGYEMNIGNYEALLERLPKDEWPKDLKRFNPNNVPGDKAEVWAMWQFRDEIAARLVAERVQLSRSLLIYEVLLAQLPEGERQALVLAAKEEQNTPKS